MRTLAVRAVVVASAYLATALAVFAVVVILRARVSPDTLRAVLGFYFISVLAAGLEPATVKASVLASGHAPGNLVGVLAVSALKGVAVAPVLMLVWWFADPRTPIPVLLLSPLPAVAGFWATDLRVVLDLRAKHGAAVWLKQGSLAGGFALLAVMVTLNLAILLGGDVLAKLAYAHIWHHPLGMAAAISIHIVQWIVASGMLLLQLSTIYYFAPDLKCKCWQWLTPGAAIGLVGWVAASLGFRVYLHYFNSFSLAYGSLGAVIVLLTWFYITGLMLLLGAEINSEIQAAVMERKLKSEGTIPQHIVAEPSLTNEPHPAAL